MAREQICQWAADLNMQNIQDPSNSDIIIMTGHGAREELVAAITVSASRNVRRLQPHDGLTQDAQEQILAEDVLRHSVHDVCMQDNILALCARIF